MEREGGYYVLLKLVRRFIEIKVKITISPSYNFNHFIKQYQLIIYFKAVSFFSRTFMQH